MPFADHINIDHATVRVRIAQLQRQIRGDLSIMNQRYDGILTSLAELDSQSNVEMQSAVRQNRKKAEATAEVLMGLLSFIEHATAQVQGFDNAWSSLITSDILDNFNLPQRGS